jgi:hypothetical protein
VNFGLEVGIGLKTSQNATSLLGACLALAMLCRVVQ